jgi:ubiquinone/menaquinone biosynthesis C-methylase UbiE
MSVLEVGPGNGRYTAEAAKIVGYNGRVTTIDIESKMIERVKKRMEIENVKNVTAEIANVYKLPYQNCSYDLIYMIAVFNEIPDQEKALTEFYRVLKPNGLLVFSELFMDPDYPLSNTLIKKVQSLPFKLKEKIGNFFYYTLKFEKI